MQNYDKKGLRNFFAAGKDYIAVTEKFTKRDARFAVLAILISAVVMNVIGMIPLMMYARGHEPANPFWFSFSMGLISFSVISVSVVILTRITGHRLSSLGLNKKGTVKSIMLAAVMGLILIIFRPGIIFGGGLAYTAALIIPRIFQLLTGSFGEGLLFRAYVGPRLYGVFRSPAMSVIVTGLLFGLMHFAVIIPLMIIGPGIELSFIFTAMPIYLLMHIIFNFVHAKYNNIWGPTLLHAFSNFLLLF